MFVLIFLSFSFAGIMGCGNKDKFEGKWTIQSGGEHMGDVVAYDYYWNFEDSENVIIPLKIDDKTLPLKFKYETDKGKLRVFNDINDIFFVPYVLDGNRLNLSFTAGDMVLIRKN